MRQVIDAANICSNRGVFHRHLKLENLLVNQDTIEVKLIDFKCAALMKKFAYEFFCGMCLNCLVHQLTKMLPICSQHVVEVY